MKGTAIIFIFMAIISGPIDMKMWKRWLLFCVDKDKPKYSYFLNRDSGIAKTGGLENRWTSGFVWPVPR